MRLGIIGTGKIGGSLAELWARDGHELRLANSRGPDTLRDLVARLGAGAQATTASEAARDSEVVLLAIPFGHFTLLPAAPFAGKILIDAGNYYPDRDGRIPALDSGSTTSSELVAAHFPGARVVKAFNTIYFERLRHEGRPTEPEAQRLAIPLVGDDAAAKTLVAGLIAELGFAPIDAGTLAEGRRQQTDTPVYNQPVGPDKARELLRQVA